MLNPGPPHVPASGRSANALEGQPGWGAAMLAALLVFLSAGYIQNSRPGWNVNSQFALTCAMVEHGTFSIDAYHEHPQLATGDKAFFEGHFYSDKSPVTAFLGVPAFAAYRYLCVSSGVELDYAQARTWTTWWTIGLCAGLLTLLLSLLLRRGGAPEGAAALIAGLWVMATPLFGYSVLFFNYLPAAVFSLGGFLLVQPVFSSDWARGAAPRSWPSAWRFLGGGFLLGLASWTLQTTALLAVLMTAMLCAMAVRGRELPVASRATSLGAWAIGGLIGAAGYAVYSWSIFGEITSPYRYEHNDMFRERMAEGFMGAGIPSLKVLGLITVHPYRGLFILFPITLVATFGCVALLRRKSVRPDALIALLFFAGLLLYNAAYYMWWGGWAYAPRHLIPALPLLAVGLLPWVVSPEGKLRPGSLGLIILIGLAGATTNVGVVALDPQPPPGLLESELLEPGAVAEWPAPFFEMLRFVLRGQTDSNWGTGLGLGGVMSLFPLALLWLVATPSLLSLRNASAWTATGLIAVAAVAVALRVPHLDVVPPGLWFDEALNAQDALQAAITGEFKLVYPEVFPREPMLITLLALAIKAGASAIESLRLVSVAIGLMTVFALYGALRSAGERGLALGAAAVLAALRWHAIMSRLLFRTLLLPLWILLVVWTAFAVRKHPSWSRMILLGLLAGGGFYTYLAWYFMLPGVLLLCLWAVWPALRTEVHRTKALAAMAVAVLTAAPLGWDYIQHPDHIASRPQAVALGGEQSDPAAIGSEILKNMKDVAGMFHRAGDHVPTVNLPEAPALDPVMGVLFAIGLGFALWGVGRRKPLEVILLGWLVLGLAPTIFTKTDSPNFLRTCVATPAVAAIVALGLVRPLELLTFKFPVAPVRVLCVMLCLIVILGSSSLAARDIHFRWARDERVWAKFNAAEAQVGRAALDAPPGVTVWIPESIRDHRTVRFLTRDLKTIHPYRNFSFLRSSPRAEGPRWVIATLHNQVFPVLQSLVPDGRYIHTFPWPGGGTWGLVYEIPAGSLPSPQAVDQAEARHPVADLSW